ncbi:MAG: transposase [Ktedonobacteraceae bacterium]|nr:transposase [Ktedonobacteraceae bacterium]
MSIHNYSWTATYLITICSEHSEPIFENHELQGILRKAWEALPARFQGLELDEFVIMPDHVHFILRIEGNVEKPVPLGRVIGAYKSITTVEWLRHIKTRGLEVVGILWQRGYHDRILPDNDALEAARLYVRNNPLKSPDGAI